MLRLLSIFIITVALIWGSDSQTKLEKSILCPCKKGVLYDHDSPAAEQLKVLLSELNKNPVDTTSIKSILLTKFDQSRGDCLIRSIKKNLSGDSFTQDQIHLIIADCYGEDLIMPSNKEGNSIILYIVIIIILFFGFSTVYIFIRKSRIS